MAETCSHCREKCTKALKIESEVFCFKCTCDVLLSMQEDKEQFFNDKFYIDRAGDAI